MDRIGDVRTWLKRSASERGDLQCPFAAAEIGRMLDRLEFAMGVDRDDPQQVRVFTFTAVRQT